MKRATQPQVIAGPSFPFGSVLLIHRPNLWSGCIGTVVSVSGGLHRLKIEGKNGSAFHAEVSGNDLSYWPFEVSPEIVKD